MWKAKKEHHEFKASLGNREKFCLKKTKQNNNKDKNKWCKDVAVICKIHLSAETSEPGEEFRSQKIHILCITSKRNQRSCEAYEVTVGKARLETRVLCLLPVSGSNSVGPDPSRHGVKCQPQFLPGKWCSNYSGIWGYLKDLVLQS